MESIEPKSAQDFIKTTVTAAEEKPHKISSDFTNTGLFGETNKSKPASNPESKSLNLQSILEKVAFINAPVKPSEVKFEEKHLLDLNSQPNLYLKKLLP